jgi:hypothetical protein
VAEVPGAGAEGKEGIGEETTFSTTIREAREQSKNNITKENFL